MVSTVQPLTNLHVRNLQGIVFDCDGTLLDTMTLHWQSWKEACAHFGLPITLPWWLAQAGKPADEILRLLCDMEVCEAGHASQSARPRSYTCIDVCRVVGAVRVL